MRHRILSGKRKPHRTFLVICEGETEQTYIEALKRYYRLPVAIKTKVSGNAINSRLVNQYLKELGLYDRSDYHIFYIYDSDVEVMVKKLNTLEGNLILTNPCIELWFLLHHTDVTKCVSSDSVIKTLTSAHPTWKHYSKGKLSSEQVKILLQLRLAAAERADSLPKHLNPSSDMPSLIRRLEDEKTG